MESQGGPCSGVDQGQLSGKNMASGVQRCCLPAGDPALGPRVQGGPWCSVTSALLPLRKLLDSALRNGNWPILPECTVFQTK